MANLQSLTRRLEEKPIRVNKWNGSEVKIALDDLVVRYLVEEAQYQEDRSLQYKKLGFLALLTLVGGATGLYARFTPFMQAKLLTGIGASCYLLLLGYFTIWVTWLAVPTCFRGMGMSPTSTSSGVPTGGSSTRKPLWLKSDLQLPQAKYELLVVDPRTGQASKINKTWKIEEWIYEDGIICGEAFCQSMKEFITSDALKTYLRSEKSN